MLVQLSPRASQMALESEPLKKVASNTGMDKDFGITRLVGMVEKTSVFGYADLSRPALG